MNKNKAYRCKSCGSETRAVQKQTDTPKCCNMVMEEIDELNACEISSTAEHSRFDHADDPCDDGRSGKI
jgi:hypothetical protein